MKLLKSLLEVMRPPFLMLTLVIMALVAATASYNGFDWSIPLFMLVVLGAVSAHISVNILNEYEDYESGLDAMTDKTPFSGGSGALIKNPQAAEAVGSLGYLFLGIVVSLGIFFIYLRSWELLPIGIAGLLLIVFYTSKITRRPWLCLISPGLAFGPLMMTGGYFVLTGEYSWVIFGLSIIVFFLVNNLLLLNQFPDESADRKAGRFNILMHLGQQNSSVIFNSFLALSYLVLAYMIIDGWLPYWTSLGFFTLILAWPLRVTVKYHYDSLTKLMPALGLNVAVVLLLPSLIAVGLVLALP